MDGLRLADRLAYGAGCAARRVGFLHDAYRPDGQAMPIDLEKRFMRLAVAVVVPGGGVSAPAKFGVPFREAWADWSYLQIGDYLVGPEGCVFVAAIEPPKPMLVVMTNATIRLSRAGGVQSAGVNAYGAILPATQTSLLSGFPASLLAGGIGDRTRAELPDDTRVPGFVALLPVIGDVQPRVGDIMSDETAARFTVTAVETLNGVWRLALAQAPS